MARVTADAWLPSRAAAQPGARPTLEIRVPDLDTDDHWERWGEDSPYFGVLTSSEYVDVAHGDAAWREFMATGQSHVADLMARLDRLHFPTSFDRVLDFGCGVGRLLVPLAARADAAVGVDVSPAMRDEARRNVKTAGLESVEIVPSDDSLSNVSGTFDLVHCYNVFQHIAPDRGMAITRRMLELTRPGGVVVLHYCTSAPALRHRVKRLTRRAPFLIAAARRLRGRNPDAPIMQMFPYPLVELFEALRIRGVEDLDVQLVEYHGSRFVQVIGRVPAPDQDS